MSRLVSTIIAMLVIATAAATEQSLRAGGIALFAIGAAAAAAPAATSHNKPVVVRTRGDG